MGRLPLLLILAWFPLQEPEVPPPPPVQEIEVFDPDAPLDPALEEALDLRGSIQELLAIFRRIDELQDVHIHLEFGVLELSGTALSSAARLQAEELAAGVPGVIYVDNRIEVASTLAYRLGPALDRAREQGIAFLRLIPVLVVAVLLLGVTAFAAAWAGRPDFPYTRITRNPFAQNLLRQVVRIAVVLFGVLVALDLLGATALVGAVLGTAGLMGLAVGFAFRDIAENYLAGVILSLRQPFAPNDLVQLAGEEGRIVRLTGRETILMTLDGNHVRIPNSLVFKSVLVNMTRNPRRRFVVGVGIAPWEDVTQALRVGSWTVAAVPGVLEHPAPNARAQELGDSSVQLRFSGWVDQQRADFGKVRSEVIRSLKEAYEREGIETPAPEFGIRILGRPGAEAELLDEPSPTPARTTRVPRFSAETESIDVSPDTTIQDEIVRELEETEEENLLDDRPRRTNSREDPGV